MKFDVIIPVSLSHRDRALFLLPYIRKFLNPKKIILITDLSIFMKENIGVIYLDENEIFPEMNIEIIKKYVGEKRAGWYFQQFLKMSYAYICKDEYYLVWDADTIPLKKMYFEDFTDQKKIFTIKEEYHKPYFSTLRKLFNNEIERSGNFSFIAEHMLINKKIMLELINKIENNNEIQGGRFFEKILYAINKEDLIGSGFSEYETYGNYVMKMYPQLYKIRTLKTLREGAHYLGLKPSHKMLEWIAKEYDTVSLENWNRVSKSKKIILELISIIARNKISFEKLRTWIS